jgi:hypothetical protein
MVVRRFVRCRRDLGQRSVPGLLAGLALAALVSGVVREPLQARSAESTCSGMARSRRLDVATDATD